MKKRVISIQLAVCLIISLLFQKFVPTSASIHLGGNHSAVLTASGDLYTWGYNAYGQLGDGATANRSTPVKMMSDVVYVSLGAANSAAITESGDLYTWGSNEYGDLGDCTTTDRSTPIKVMSGVSQVSAGGDHTAVVKNDGAMYIWGYNGWGKLGNGTTTNSLTPVKLEQFSPKIISGTFNYRSTFTESDEPYTFTYNDDWFSDSAYTYNHDLAIMSLDMSMAAFQSYGTDKAANIKDLFDQLGFGYTVESVSYPTPTEDSIGYAIGSKTLPSGETLIAVGIRGAGYASEWASNFSVGTASEHSGFSKAAHTVVNAVKSYISSENITGNIKIWINGYSRAAATANIAAFYLDLAASSKSIKGLSADGVYAYCFECPQTVSGISGSSGLMNNIFNIVNYIDAVTKVAPGKWSFSRYGITYYLPSAEQTSKYSAVKKKMLTNYSKILSSAGVANAASQAATDTEEMSGQGTFLDGIVGQLADFLGGSNAAYAAGYQDTFQNMGKSIGESYTSGTVFESLIEGLPAFALLHPFNTTKLAINCDEIGYAHYPELCLAWLNTLDGSSGYVSGKYRLLKVNCPVDVYVYDGSGTLIAEISDGEAVEIDGSTIGAYVDENNQKTMVLPPDEEYTVKIAATDDGTMDYTVTECSAGENETRDVDIHDVALTSGQTFTGNIEGDFGESADSFALTDNNGNVIRPDSDSALNPFTDITESDWYYDSVLLAYGDGLMVGTTETVFDPAGNVTIAQAVVMASRARSNYCGDEHDFSLSGDDGWYDPYVDYAIADGIIKSGDFSDYDACASRAEMAYIFAHALPEDALPAINEVSELPDVAITDEYGEEIFLLYRAGVLTGNDTSGTFTPDSNITRAEAATIITRIALSGERKTVSF